MKSIYHEQILHRPRTWDRLYNEPFLFKNVKVIIDKERQELSGTGGDKRDLTTKCSAGFWIGYRGRKNMLVKIIGES